MSSFVDIDDDKTAKKAPRVQDGKMRTRTKIFFILLVVIVFTVQCLAAKYIMTATMTTEQLRIDTELANLESTHQDTIKKIDALSESIRNIVKEIGVLQEQHLKAEKVHGEVLSKIEALQKADYVQMKEDVEKRLHSFEVQNAKEIADVKASVVKAAGSSPDAANHNQNAGDSQHPSRPPGLVIDNLDENGGEIVPAGGDEFVPLPPKPHDPLDDLTPDQRNTKRRETVIREFIFSWNAYRDNVWGKDEFQPLTKDYKNWAKHTGLGLTILDSTLFLMGDPLRTEFERALKWIVEDLNLEINLNVNNFESTIRLVGSMISAYEMTGETNQKLLEKAVLLANKLLWAYNTSSGVPHSSVNLQTHNHYNPSWTGGSSVLSEFGSVQLEFRTLSFLTKNPIYDMKATHVMNIIDSGQCENMLCPTYYSPGGMEWTSDHITLGALGDSFYEYLLKQYILTGKTEKRYKDMFLKAAKGISDKLIHYSHPSRQMFIAEIERGEIVAKMDHLACFAAGMYALAAAELKDEVDKKTLVRWREIAEGLTETCHLAYAKQRTGIAPEVIEFQDKQDFVNGEPFYLLRPETVESYFYMWRLTKNVTYRDWGWDMLTAVIKHCRIESGGYSGLRHVNLLPAPRDNLMQSFWLAETLKYLFLLFSDDSVLDLNQWVLNTEAHPLKVRSRDPMDVLLAYEEKHGDLPYAVPYVMGAARIETPKMKAARQANEKRGVREKPAEKVNDVIDEYGGLTENKEYDLAPLANSEVSREVASPPFQNPEQGDENKEEQGSPPLGDDNPFAQDQPQGPGVENPPG